MADVTSMLVLLACILVLSVLLGIWLRFYRRQRRTPSEFGKATVQESSIKKSRPS
jgi:hypothetical protein